MNGPLKVDNPITSKVDKYKMRALTLFRIKKGWILQTIIVCKHVAHWMDTTSLEWLV